MVVNFFVYREESEVCRGVCASGRDQNLRRCRGRAHEWSENPGLFCLYSVSFMSFLGLFLVLPQTFASLLFFSFSFFIIMVGRMAVLSRGMRLSNIFRGFYDVEKSN